MDLGLQSHRIKCRVHPDFKLVFICEFYYNTHLFRLVLIADKDKVYMEFPTPLINRLEKHYLVTSIILSKDQRKLMEKIEIWVKGFSKMSNMM